MGGAAAHAPIREEEEGGHTDGDLRAVELPGRSVLLRLVERTGVPDEPTDGQIKKAVIDRLHEDPHTRGETIKVDVKQKVVILGGQVGTWLAKRAAGDDAWDTSGVADVSNLLTIGQPDAPASAR